MNVQIRPIRCKLLVLGIACALGLPLVVNAQPQANAGAGTQAADGSAVSTREQALEQRVNQLQQELMELKQEVQAQRAAPPPPAPPAAAPPPPPATPAFTSAPGVSVALHGFISAVGYYQSQVFTPHTGAGAEFPAVGSNNDRGLSGVDVRNTRFWIDLTGIKLANDWSVGAHLEADLWGGNNGSGAYSGQMPLARLRQAFIDVASPDGRTTFTIGQQFDLVTLGAMFPVSNAKITFPYGFGIGAIGWRFPGIVVKQVLGHPVKGGPEWTLEAGAFGGSYSGPGNNDEFESAGAIDFRPQVGVRLGYHYHDLLAYLVGHYASMDLRGVNGDTFDAPPGHGSKINSHAVEVGVRWMPDRWRFRLAAFTGRALANTVSTMFQFGDIKETGVNSQLGYMFTNKLGIYVSYAIDHPNANDILAWTGRGANGLVSGKQAGMQVVWNDGPFGLGLDYLWSSVQHQDPVTLEKNSIVGHQVMASAVYHF